MKTRSVFFAALAVLGFATISSCKKDDPIVAIGQHHQGGIVFYVDGTGKHGLIAAPNELTGVWQNCNGNNCGTLINGANGEALGTGKQNTIDIISAYGTDNAMAAYMCDQLVIEGYDDWFLPSTDEIGLMSTISDQITHSAFYWSSTQSNDKKAYLVSFNSSGTSVLMSDDKEESKSFRAVRAF